MIAAPDFAYISFKLSDSLRETGDIGGTLTYIGHATDIFKLLKNNLYLNCLERQDNIQNLLGNLPASLELFKECNRLLFNRYCKYPQNWAFAEELGLSFNFLERVHFGLWNYKKALPLLKQTI